MVITRFAAEAQPLTMADQEVVVAELFVHRHINKYLSRKLNPATAHTTPYSTELATQIMEICRFRVQLASVSVAGTKLSLSIGGGHLPNLDPRTHQQVMDLCEELYQHEFHLQVDQLHYGPMRLGKKEAIMFFRSTYSITEDDLSYRTSERNYQRYEAAKKRPRKKGRPRKHFFGKRSHKRMVPRS